MIVETCRGRAGSMTLMDVAPSCPPILFWTQLQSCTEIGLSLTELTESLMSLTTSCQGDRVGDIDARRELRARVIKAPSAQSPDGR